jgi:hypothetical protein
MRRHLKTVNGALDIDDPAAETSLHNHVYRIIYVQSASPRQAINILNVIKKLKIKYTV